MTSLSLLIVDDEDAQREILSGYLKKKKFHVQQAASVAEALSVLKKNPADIVFTDHKMPDRTGLDLLMEIRERHPETTVIMMTAFGTIESAGLFWAGSPRLCQHVELRASGQRRPI